MPACISCLSHAPAIVVTEVVFLYCWKDVQNVASSLLRLPYKHSTFEHIEAKPLDSAGQYSTLSGTAHGPCRLHRPRILPSSSRL